jgi:hypothetical protein
MQYNIVRSLKTGVLKLKCYYWSHVLHDYQWFKSININNLKEKLDNIVILVRWILYKSVWLKYGIAFHIIIDFSSVHKDFKIYF